MKRSLTKLNIVATIAILLIASSYPAFTLTADPMDLSVGARSMGMGKAYVAVAEDAETVFVNPAGLGTISSLKLTSMYTSLLDDLNYTVIAGVYPMDNESGTLGAGIVNQTANSINLYNNYGTSEGYGTYGSNMIFVSHGFNITKKWLPSISELYGGYTVKYFMKSGSGTGLADLNGSGFGMDLAVLYKPKHYMSYGLTLQNALSTDMSYANGSSDPMGMAAKVGAKIAVLGDPMDREVLFQNESRLDVALDCDMGVTYKIPSTLHLGFEYKPQMGLNYIDKILTLRTGINQVAAPEGNLSNLTVGLGINYQGVEFNYAYSPAMGDIPESSSHFFSIAYVGVPTVIKPVEEMKPLISEIMPDDKIITKDQTVLIQGKLNNPEKVQKVEINNAGVKITDNGAFEMNVGIPTVGKHLVTVVATDMQGRTEEKTVRIIRLVTFSDVGNNHWAGAPIEKMATTGLVEGYPNGTFQPERALSRAELATLLVKSKGTELPIASDKVFKDVSTKHWAAKYIKGAMNMGLVQGYPDKTFKPNNKITRTEGVVVLSRFDALSSEARLEIAPYPDLTAKYWASPLISAARQAGFLDYIGEKDFEPKRELTRAEAIEILAKTTYGRAKIDSLMDWTVGFEPGIARPAVASAPIKEIVRGSANKPEAGKGSIAENIKDFSDINDEYWASEPIKYLATAGVMSGYPDGTFRPDRVVTRAELSAILIKAKEAQVQKGIASGFADVPKNSWMAPYVKASVDSGYLSAKKAGKFEPNRGASRSDTVMALVKFDNMELPLDLKMGPFPDMTAREGSSKYVAAAKDAGMLEYLRGQDFEGNKSITRAEVAAMLAKTKIGQAKIEAIKSSAKYEQPY